jgi:hypothetical protein
VKLLRAIATALVLPASAAFTASGLQQATPVMIVAAAGTRGLDITLDYCYVR